MDRHEQSERVQIQTLDKYCSNRDITTIDLLKIDGSFIRDVIDDPLDDAAVRCFVDVAGVVGVKTVAEFVDRPAVLQRVREIGIDYAQGFLLHRPEPIEGVLGVCHSR